MRPDGFDREQGPGGLEVRTIAAELTRASDTDNPKIEGVGSVYNQTTTIGGFFFEWDEEVLTGAWTKSITSDDKIVSTMNHNLDWLIGSTSAGTLRFNDTDEGLGYIVDINTDDPNAVSVHARVSRGDIAGSSVWFRVISETWTEPTDDNGLERPLRQIAEAQLFEVGPVVFPAFPQTTAVARGIDGMLAAAGITNPAKRARWAFDLTLDPDEAEERIRELFRRQPDLRANVCETEAADGTPSEPSHPHLAVARRQLELLR